MEHLILENGEISHDFVVRWVRCFCCSIVIFAIFRSHFGVGSGMMDDTAYIIIPQV